MGLDQKWHRHTNPDGSEGGWVHNSAKVAKTAFIGPNGKVANEATIEGHARVIDFASISQSATVKDHAVIYGHGMVGERACVREYATVGEHACIGGNVVVEGYSVIKGKTLVLAPDLVISKGVYDEESEMAITVKGYNQDKPVIHTKDGPIEGAASFVRQWGPRVQRTKGQDIGER